MTDYHSEFHNFDSFAHQTDSIAVAVAQICEELGKAPTTFVDVGANDGTLMQKILLLLARRNPKVSAYALEPDQISYAKLEALFKNNSNVEIDNVDFQEWAEQHDGLKGKVDLLLNCHTLYHFQRDEWQKIIEEGYKLIGDKGRHVIVIDSEKTSINQLKKTLDECIGEKRRITVYGEVLVGCDLKEFFVLNGVNYDHRTIRQPIIIPKDKKSLENFARILGFIFRHDPKDVLIYAKGPVQDFMEQPQFSAGKNYSLPRTQDMFVLKG